MVDDSGQRSGAQAIERALAIIAAFEDAPDLGISELARRTGLNVATTHRIVRALVRGGVLAQDPESGRYQLGYRAAILGSLAIDRLGLSAAHAELALLAERTGEAVSLGVRDASESVIVMQVASPSPAGVEVAPGARTPFHACAMGKSLVAFGRPPDRAQHALETLTPRTITNWETLERELTRVRRRGYAVNDQEIAIGVRGIGAPVYDDDGHVTAAVAIAAPAGRLRLRDIPRAAEEVRQTAAHLRGALPPTS